MSAEAMYPFPPVTHAVFFLSPADIVGCHLTTGSKEGIRSLVRQNFQGGRDRVRCALVLCRKG
jgi:hypothetical protein